MQNWEILKELTATDSKNEKQAIIERQAKSGNDAFFAGLRLALDPMITFGVKVIPEKNLKQIKISYSYEKSFSELCLKLSNRDLTGDAARDAIFELMLETPIDEWNGWYRLILMKDLKAGFSESTVNKAVAKFPQYIIPVFEVQLAKDCLEDDGNLDETVFQGTKILENKLDGMRLITIAYPNGKVDQYSRNGKEMLNFAKIKDQIAKVAPLFSEPMVLDGEVMGASFQDLMKQARRKEDVQTSDSILNLFDMLPLAEFKAGIGTKTQLQRTEALKEWYAGFETDLPNVTAVGFELVDLDTEVGKARLFELNKIALEGGYEGLIVKDTKAVYECKRSKSWSKLKPFIEESLTVVDVEEGKAESKFVGTMGALVCEGLVGDKFVRVHCGGGFSIQQRAQIWADHTGKSVEWKKKVGAKWITMTEKPDCKKGIVGLVAEVRADALTKSQDSDVWSMRFPRFKTWRGFTAGEKI